MTSERKRLFLVDGSALVFRSYYAFIRNPLINSKGENTSAVFGVTRSLLKIVQEEQPDYLAVVFDRPEPTFRHQLYEQYKATRQEAPVDLIEQLPRVREVVEALGIPIIEKPGFEADDIIGTLAKRAEQQGLETYVVSGDKDLLQLVSPAIKVYNPRRAGEAVEVLDVAGVEEKLGVPPQRVVDYLALAGDASDNVPGVPGIGPKGAAALLKEFGDLENLMRNVENIKRDAVRKAIVEHQQELEISRKLVTIDCNVDVDLTFDQLVRREPDAPRLMRLFHELEFASLADQFAQRGQQAVTYRAILTREELEWLITQLRAAGKFALDLETTSLNPIDAEIVGLSFAWRAGEAYYVPVQAPALDFTPWAPAAEVLALLKPLLEDPGLKKCGQNVKFDMAVLKMAGVTLAGVEFDSMIASYLLNPSGRQHNLDSLALEHFGHKKIAISELIGSGKKQRSMAEVPLAQIAEYACEDADFAWRLQEKLAPQLHEAALWELFESVEMPLVPVLMQMELDGVSLDVPFLEQMSQELSRQMDGLMAQIYDQAGEEFNINSTQQLGTILFEKLKLRKVRRTKTGYSTDVAVLEELAKEHPLPRTILEYRQLAKLKSTYVDALPKLVNPRTGRVHTSFNQAVTATGRLSSSDPNLQNIPIRTEMGSQIRKAFIPKDDDHVILDADYSQIELRIMAHLSGDPRLRQAFVDGEDVHRRTAALVFKLDPEEVTPEHRRRAKEVNFGIMYGMGAYGLSTRLDIPVEEAEAFIATYFATYPGVHQYIMKTLEQAHRQGYVTTLLNRRRYLPEINSDNRRMREFAERTAINMPIQGSAADLIKVAMINISRALRQSGLKTKMILQVHDELVFEVPKNEVEQVRTLVRHEMEHAITMDVPIKVDIGVGRNWLEAH
ncbi:MAG: DNA polymerase I [bacterium]|nr:DNA polymerase I [candidate division KSB1 bacterium]MDH7561249.1 DNA polymerase I [bacterium]